MAPTYSTAFQPAYPPGSYTSGARLTWARPAAGSRVPLPVAPARQPPTLPCPHPVFLSPPCAAVSYPYHAQQQQQCGPQQPCQQGPYGYAAAPGTVPPHLPQTKTRKAAAKLTNWLRSKQGKAVLAGMDEGQTWGYVWKA
jgi:hypothetical protein